MIIKGKSRATPGALAAHLGNAEKNERVQLLETRGTIAQDLQGALVELDAYAAGTRCTKTMYHAAISPQPPHRLSPEQRGEALDALEAKLGLTGHARVVVLHEKLGREHLHVVWSRIDLQKMRAVPDSHNYRRHEECARDLERRFGHEHVQGAHHEREGIPRPDRTPSRAELRQEERTGISGKKVKADVTRAFRTSDGPEAFRGALADQGYILAKGDRRDFIIIDRAGGIHSLARRVEDMKAGQLREFMSSMNPELLPNAEQARELAAERAKRTKELEESFELAEREVSYATGLDYVSQSQAALKDHKRRQDALDKVRNDRLDPLAEPSWDHLKSGSAEVDLEFADRFERSVNANSGSDVRGDLIAGRDRFEEQARKDQANEESTRRQDNELKPSASSSDHRFDSVEMTDAMQARMSRLLDTEDSSLSVERSDDEGPDKQREAPGGGRSRSR